MKRACGTPFNDQILIPLSVLVDKKVKLQLDSEVMKFGEKIIMVTSHHSSMPTHESLPLLTCMADMMQTFESSSRTGVLNASLNVRAALASSTFIDCEYSYLPSAFSWKLTKGVVCLLSYALKDYGGPFPRRDVPCTNHGPTLFKENGGERVV